MSLFLPEGAEVLSVANQDEMVAMWISVDPASCSSVVRRFRLVGTGNTIPTGAKFIGTVLLAGGRLVLHVFEEARD